MRLRDAQPHVCWSLPLLCPRLLESLSSGTHAAHAASHGRAHPPSVSPTLTPIHDDQAASLIAQLQRRCLTDASCLALALSSLLLQLCFYPRGSTSLVRGLAGVALPASTHSAMLSTVVCGIDTRLVKYYEPCCGHPGYCGQANQGQRDGNKGCDGQHMSSHSDVRLSPWRCFAGPAV